MPYPYPLETGCEDYSFLDQTFARLWTRPDPILTDSIETLKLDTAFDESDVITSSISSGLFLQSVSMFLVLLNCSLLPASDLIHYDTRLRYSFPYVFGQQDVNILIDLLFCSHPVAFGLWFSSPPDNITLNPANRKADQSLSEFQTGIGVVWLVIEQLHFSHQSFTCWYHFLFTRFWGRRHFSFWSMQVAYQDSWHSGQCCVKMGW